MDEAKAFSKVMEYMYIFIAQPMNTTPFITHSLLSAIAVIILTDIVLVKQQMKLTLIQILEG